MNIKLIIKGKELSDISEEAKLWFYESILNGNDGPFVVNRVNGKTNGEIVLVEQMELKL